MSEAAFLRDFDANFFAAWGAVCGGIAATYTSPLGTTTAVEVLVDHDITQFGDDQVPVSAPTTVVTFRLAQVVPETLGTVTVDGATYTLVQRISISDESLSRWAVQP